ncbi:hypothetical protein HYV57_05200 [Candidatus Peregrinibacteria bacterium]|nr:hypothetical protein [Candidatus Peregrinibacteria bacterium]
MTNRILHGASDLNNARTELVIGFPDRIISLNPTSYLASDRARLVNIYETLIRTDANLRIEPSLALSWGRIDDTTYQFELRPNVLFHNGERLTSADVEASFSYARKYPYSQISHLVASMKSFQALDDLTFRVTTLYPDPLFLNKLTAVFILPKTFVFNDADGLVTDEKNDSYEQNKVSTFRSAEIDEENFDTQPAGTGPYQLFTFDKTTSALELKRFDSYWGKKSSFEYVSLLSLEDKNERIRSVQNGALDILAAVPASLVFELQSYDVNIITYPSLEVNFLVLNASNLIPHNIFTKKKAREAVSLAINKDELVKFTQQYVTPHDQFVSSGVFGYDPTLSPYSYDIEKATALMREIEHFVRVPLTVDLPTGLESFGKYLSDQMYEIGFSPTIQYHSLDELQKKIASGTSQMYIFGWRSELGDSNDFFESVVHSKHNYSESTGFQNDIAFSYGQFNGSNYSNPQVDQLIEESLKNMNTEGRLSQLHQIMKILVNDDIFGIPLFESQVIYATNPKVHFEPRLDGLIYAQNISLRPL